MMNKLINTEIYDIHMTDIHIPEIGDLAICCNCYEEKQDPDIQREIDRHGADNVRIIQ